MNIAANFLFRASMTHTSFSIIRPLYAEYGHFSNVCSQPKVLNASNHLQLSYLSLLFLMY